MPTRGHNPPVFVSPNVPGIPTDNNNRVYEAYGTYEAIIREPPRTRTLFISACAGTLVFGIMFAVLGTVLRSTGNARMLPFSLAQQRNCFLLLYLGVFCASIIMTLIDHVGNKANLAVSAAIVAGAMLAFAAAHSFVAASVAAVLGWAGAAWITR